MVRLVSLFFVFSFFPPAGPIYLFFFFGIRSQAVNCCTNIEDGAIIHPSPLQND